MAHSSCLMFLVFDVGIYNLAYGDYNTNERNNLKYEKNFISHFESRACYNFFVDRRFNF